MKTTTINKAINKSIDKVIDRLEQNVSLQYSVGCTFWACHGTPENNIIRNMVTCKRCQTIIITSREIKKLKKLKTT